MASYFRASPIFWNVASARELDFAAQVVWWCAVQLRTSQ